MGEVYRARDTKLQRDVAIKVLPEALARDTERLARFEREARTLASLNHPNIAQIHGFEESDGIKGLVMELVEGPTLADRIAQGPIPVDEALPIAKQIAEALEAAHEQGIIHRDLKPANVKVRPDGTVKVLDFGLAKALDAAAQVVPESHSPTITSPAMTRAGVLLGTAAYMSPEQVRAVAVDRRADIWAFGCVLFEMLTGRRLFDGATISDTLAEVLRKEIDWQALPSNTPAPARSLLRRCLARDVRSRLRDIGDARLTIEEHLTSPTDTDSSVAVPPAARSKWRHVVPWAALIAVATLTAIATRSLSRPDAPVTPSLHVTIGLGDGLTMNPVQGATAVISPDGTTLAFVGRKGAKEAPQLYVRRLDQLQARALAGTENASSPFFSLDGQWLGFFTDFVPRPKLNIVPISGGAVTALGDVSDNRGGSWAPDGSIVFTPSGERGTTLMRVSRAGEPVQPVTKLEGREVTHRWPQVLPGGTSVLFTAHSQAGSYDQASLVVASLNGDSRKVVHRGGYHGRYLPTGHLAYIHKTTLFVAPFDLAGLEVTGPAAPVLEDVTSDPTTAGAQFAFSNDGALVYTRGQGLNTDVTILWAEQSGTTRALRSLPGDYANLRFSPDGRWLAMNIGQNLGVSAIWILDPARDVMTRLVAGGVVASNPTWTLDGKRIAFAAQEGGELVFNMYWQKADGTGGMERLLESKRPQYPSSFHPGGKILAFSEQAAPGNLDIGLLPIDGSETAGWKVGTPRVILNGPDVEVDPTFSPDGRWLAYVSLESGLPQIYVRSFPGLQGRSQVSIEGSFQPTWSPNRSELFYCTLEGRIMVVPYRVSGDTFTPDKAREWSPGLRSQVTVPNRAFALHNDGRRLAVFKGADLPVRDHVVLMLNFFDKVRRVAPRAN
jgi:Tol biopolymer transport system component